jgi:peptide/nickel transport system substrate-binding protein
VFDTDRAPLDDVRVRRALAHATDIRGLAAANGWPDDRLAQGPLAPGSPFFSAAAYPEFNLDRARTLVREYVADPKGGKGGAIVVTVHTAATDTRLLSQVVEQWTRAGIKASLVVDEPQDLRRRGAQGELDAVWLDTVPIVDPDQLWPYLVPEANRAAGTFTYAGNGDPAISGPMADGRARFDAAGRRDAYARVQRALADSLPFLWILRPEPRLAVSASVRDARNATLPDGSPAMPFVGGVHRLTETWIAP